MPIKNKKIAIIGSGISGLSCAYLTAKQGHSIHLFEKDDYFGGHSLTVEDPKSKNNIDIGFMVFNELTYPSLIKLFRELKIKTHKSNMSFSFEKKDSNFIYNGSGLLNMFCNKVNFLSIPFYKFIFDILKFNKIIKSRSWEKKSQLSLKEFIKINNFGSNFTNFYLYPLCAAIWSSNCEDIENFPIKFLFEFLINHRLVDIKNRPQWFTVDGGSKTYVKKLISFLEKNNASLHLNKKIDELTFNKKSNKWNLSSNKNTYDGFDCIIFACHSDQAYKLLSGEGLLEQKNLLKKLKYQNNKVVLHTDDSFMPSNKKAWASWNYSKTKFSNKCDNTYFINNLQKLKNTSKNYFVSINPSKKIQSDKMIYETNLSHPLFENSTIKDQESLKKINGQNNIFFAGAYLGYGFHEDGIKSAIEACKKLDPRCKL